MLEWITNKPYQLPHLHNHVRSLPLCRSCTSSTRRPLADPRVQRHRSIDPSQLTIDTLDLSLEESDDLCLRADKQQVNSGEYTERRVSATSEKAGLSRQRCSKCERPRIKVETGSAGPARRKHRFHDAEWNDSAWFRRPLGGWSGTVHTFCSFVASI